MQPLIPAWNGELVIEMDGLEATLRPTFRAAQEIERLAGGSLLTLAGEFESGTPRLTAIAAIVTACLNAGGTRHPATGRSWTTDDLGVRLLGPQLAGFAEIAAAMLAHLLSGGQTGKAALGEASAAVRIGLLKRVDGLPATKTPVTGPAGSPLPSAASA